MKLIFATKNKGKVVEMEQILGGLDIEFLGMEAAGVEGEPVEDGATFEDNARKKALWCMEKTGQWCFADDSGICIDALGSRPGIHTRRWAGIERDEDIRAYTLKQLEGVPFEKRTAQFISVVALVAPDGREWIFKGVVPGKVPLEPRGSNILPQLPYDPIFIPDESGGRTFAEMTDREKNAISHRGRAFAKLKEFLGTIS